MSLLTDLDAYGVLTLLDVPPELGAMTEEEKHLLTTLQLQTEKVLLGTYARKQYSKDCLLKLDIAGLVEWHSDARGKPFELGLTWRGEEAAKTFLKIAKNKSLQRNKT